MSNQFPTGTDESNAEISFLKLDADITLRRMIVRPRDPRGIVLLLHGFPETIYAVGDFAPFDRPQNMQERLQALKAPQTNEAVRAQFNTGRDEILENAVRRGLTTEERFEISPAFKADMAQGWNHGALTTADAFARYYAEFTRDQNDLEANILRLKTPVKVVWGERDPYINKEMGLEFARRVQAGFTLLAGIGHHPHLQNPHRTLAEIRGAFD